jgi:hypothetical protein
MLRSESRPITTSQYKILYLPTKHRAETPQSKCSKKGCANSRLTGSIWCSEHPNCGPSTSCDNLPAIIK